MFGWLPTEQLIADNSGDSLQQFARFHGNSAVFMAWEQLIQHEKYLSQGRIERDNQRAMEARRQYIAQREYDREQERIKRLEAQQERNRADAYRTIANDSLKDYWTKIHYSLGQEPFKRVYVSTSCKLRFNNVRMEAGHWYLLPITVANDVVSEGFGRIDHEYRGF